MSLQASLDPRKDTGTAVQSQNRAGALGSPRSGRVRGSASAHAVAHPTVRGPFSTPAG